MAVSFRVNAKNFSLTYPRCNEEKEDLLQHLQSLLPDYVCVSKETHSDGGYHLHAAVTFGKRKNIKAANFFDFREHHPNIQAAKNATKWIEYVKKDGNYVESGTPPSAHCSRSTLIDLYSVDSKELFNFCINNKIGYGYYQEEKRRRNQVDTTIETSEHEGTMCFHLSVTPFPSEQYSIVITGATGLGKTTWALKNAPKPSLLVSHMDQLKKFEAEKHLSIIFDDMTFSHMPVTAQIHMVDHNVPRAIHIRYGTVTLPACTVKIFTSNEFPFSYHPAIARRIKHIETA